MRMRLLIAVVLCCVSVLVGCGGGSGGDSSTGTISDLSGTWSTVGGYKGCPLTEKGSIEFTYYPASSSYSADFEVYNGVEPSCTNSPGYEWEGVVESGGKPVVPLDLMNFLNIISKHTECTGVIFTDSNTIEVQGTYDGHSAYLILKRSGTGDNDSSFKHITVDEIKSAMLSDGYTETDIQIVHEDGFGNGGAIVDIGRVIMSRISGNEFSNDIGYYFDYKLMESMHDDIISPSAILYIDMDRDSSTGMFINGIGAEIRLSDVDYSTLVSGVSVWHDAWVEVSTGSSEGAGTDSEYVEGGMHVFFAINGTSPLQTANTRGVITLELLTQDNTGTEILYDSTQAFDIPIR